jgi:hypothetical protein
MEASVRSSIEQQAIARFENPTSYDLGPQRGHGGTIMLKRAFVVAALLLAATAANAAEWGSIAFSPSTGTTGYSYNYDTRSTAGAWAMSYCDDSANDCRIVVNFQNACGAVAVGRRGGWGADWGPTRRSAEANAIAVCQSHDGGCRTKRWVCSQ